MGEERTKRKLQNVIFPTDEKLKNHWKLFYTGPACVLDPTCTKLHIPSGMSIGFSTYLNGFSLQTWKRYTPLDQVELQLTVQGHFRLQLVGYSLNPTAPERHELYVKEYTFPLPQEICVPYPATAEDQLLAFEIDPYEDCILHQAAYCGLFPKGCERDVVLSLVTTTCRKEAFITHNIQLLKDQLLAEGSELRDALYIHVVDNGRTLDPASINGYHVAVHPNKNTGGSGGYARGMMESLHQVPSATHVLLMDDDVLVLPESIRRTYRLLSLLRPEYTDSFISGAMLEYDAMDTQHEDVGTILPDGGWRPARPKLDLTELTHVLEAGRELLPMRQPYAGWWYCCIPVRFIRNQGLPLPLFLRCDDIEYSLRCRPDHFLTMPGICIWHMGFAGKYSAALDLYQRMRNMLAAKAITGAFAEVDIPRLWTRLYRQQLREYAYHGAEALLMALEDYLQGPDLFRQDRGEELLHRASACNEVLRPLSEFDIEVRLEDVYKDSPRSLADRILYVLTCNGQRCFPKALLRKKTGIIGYDDSYQPQSQTLRRQLLAVNVWQRTAALRRQDRVWFRTLEKRRRRLMKQFRRSQTDLAARYAAAREELTGEAFWRRYLNLDHPEQP